MTTADLLVNVTETQATVMVSSAAGGAGASLGLTTKTARVQLTNRSMQLQNMEFKVGTGDWKPLNAPDDSISLPIDLSTTTILTRKAGAQVGSVPLEVRMFTAGDAVVDNGSTWSGGGGSGVFPKAQVAAWSMRSPGVLSSPPTVTAGVSGAASAISGSVLFSAFNAGLFTFSGGPAPRGTNYPGYLGVTLGVFSAQTSNSTCFVDFNIDNPDATGRFEIEHVGRGDQIRVLVRQPGGDWQAVAAAPTFTTPADGGIYRDLVTMGAAGFNQIRLECYNSTFIGIRAVPSTGISAIKQLSTTLNIIVGDSFTEGTFSDSGTTYAGGNYVAQLAYRTGEDFWASAKGGTGWLKAGSFQKFRDRLAGDVFPYKPNRIWFAGGINDVGTYSAADILAEVTTTLALCKSALPNASLVCLAPFWPSGLLTGGFVSTFFAIRDAIKAATLAAGGTFLDIQELGIPYFLRNDVAWSSALTAGVASGATNVSVASLPSYFSTANPGSDQWVVMLGSGDSQTVRRVNSISGTGPYSLGLNAAVGVALASGAPVRLAGAAYITGTGKQGSTVGDGDADRYTGPDGTHPTLAGHGNIARVIAEVASRVAS